MSSTPNIALRQREQLARTRLNDVTGALDRRSGLLLAIAIATYILIFTILSGLKLALFRQGFDMAGNEQTIWNTLHGRPFRISVFAFMDYDFDDGPVLLQLPLAALYGIYPSPYTLLALQSLALGLAAWPLYLLGRRVLPQPWQALALALIYLLHPWTQHTNMYEFQLRSFMLPFALGALLFLWQERLRLFYLCLFLMLCTKTEAALVVAMFGLYALLLRRPWPYVVVPLVAGAAWFVVALWVIVPAFSKGDFIGQIYSYEPLGKSISEVIVSLFTRPLLVLQVISEPRKLSFLAQLVGLLGFLPLFGTASLLALPVLFVNIISPNAVQFSLNYQYQALTLPFLLVGAAQGLVRVARLGTSWFEADAPSHMRRQGYAISTGMLALIAIMLAANVLLNNVVLSLARNHEPPARVRDAHQILARVPPEAAIAASSFLAPHLAQRERLYFFPGNGSYPQAYIDLAEYIVADTKVPKESEQALLAEYMRRPGWRLEAQAGDFVLLRRTQ